MGVRGPAPKPTALRKYEGNPSRRPYPANEPVYATSAPEKPARTSRAAKSIWNELVAEMQGVGVLARVDKQALWQLAEDEAMLVELYAGIWDMARMLEKRAREEGKKLPGGALYQVFSMTSGRLAMSTIRNLANRVIIERREFGLTPSSRSRIESGGDGNPGAIDPLEMKLCG